VPPLKKSSPTPTSWQGIVEIQDGGHVAQDGKSRQASHPAQRGQFPLALTQGQRLAEAGPG
jgi:hypothetical protein